MNSARSLTWPILTRYDQNHLNCIALPIGGIGTGTISLGGRGNLRDWEVVNRPAKNFNPDFTFFALYAKPAGCPPVTRLLEGILPPPYEGAGGCTARLHGLPRFRKCSFAAAYPFGQVYLSDPEVPVEVRLETFNPLIPGDAEASGIPVAVIRFVLRNKTKRRVAAAICASLKNFIGMDGKSGKPLKNRNVFRQTIDPVTVQGVWMTSAGVDPQAEQFGTLALTTLAGGAVTCRTAWPALKWNGAILDFWDDFSADGQVEERTDPGDGPIGSLAVPLALPARETGTITFLITWHFPNRLSWSQDREKMKKRPLDPWVNSTERIGNYYTTRYADAWDVAVRTAAALPELEAQTVTFVRSFCESMLPAVVKEAALYNLSTLRTQTAFRLPDGHLLGWEGCSDQGGCCHGSCTHVWNYEQTTPFLFGDLARSMRDVEFRYMTKANGFMSGRTELPLDRAQEFGLAHADGQPGCILKLYREWQLSGDSDFLRALWPKARKAVEFCWIPGGWDADQDGVMEGCQHNTSDVEYFGPNPLMTVWYLGALRATEEMARFLGEADFAERCRRLFENGRRWVDEHLFNGDYYEQEIRPVDPKTIAPGLRITDAGIGHGGATDLSKPDFQVGQGCLADQLVGQVMAHICGLGYLLDQRHIRRTLQSIMKYNFQESLFNHFTNMRSYALNGESGLLMCSYPRGQRPAYPFPYFSEVWTGVEYTAAVGLIYAGLTAEGLHCIQAVRRRHDGRKRNPFDEPECGHHYARAMAAWGAGVALTGFQYSGIEQSLTLAPVNGSVFWSNGYAWGTCRLRRLGSGYAVRLTVLYGQLTLKKFALRGIGDILWADGYALKMGASLAFRIPIAKT